MQVEKQPKKNAIYFFKAPSHCCRSICCKTLCRSLAAETNKDDPSFSFSTVLNGTGKQINWMIM